MIKKTLMKTRDTEKLSQFDKEHLQKTYREHHTGEKLDSFPA